MTKNSQERFSEGGDFFSEAFRKNTTWCLTDRRHCCVSYPANSVLNEIQIEPPVVAKPRKAITVSLTEI